MFVYLKRIGWTVTSENAVNAWYELIMYARMLVITKTRLFKYIENFNPKTENFKLKNSDIFHISVQNIDYRYSLEPPRRGGSNEYQQSMFLSRKEK